MAANPKVVHVIGAGIAGLSAGVHAAQAGAKARLYEAAPQAGGRCRSFFDKTLRCQIDNGNHLLLAANQEAMALIALAGAQEKFQVVENGLPFVDVQTGERWTLPASGRVGELAAAVPGVTRWETYMGLARLLIVGRKTIIKDCFSRSPHPNPPPQGGGKGGGESMLCHRLIEPLAVSILNTPAATASSAMFRHVLRELRRAESMAACLPRTSWQEALVDPLVEYIRQRGGEVGISCRVKALDITDGRVKALRLENCAVEVGAEDAVILAAPPWAAAELLPGLTVPDEYMPIVNVHYRTSPLPLAGEGGAERRVGVSSEGHHPPNLPPQAGGGVIGIIGGTAEWVFVRDGIISTTTSAAVGLVDEEDEVIAGKVWKDIVFCHPERAQRAEGSQVIAGDPSTPGVPPFAQDDIPPYRVIKEKRATFACTPENLKKRPSARTKISNLFLAGDYMNTGLPATIEGAAKSGKAAARHAVGSVP